MNSADFRLLAMDSAQRYLEYLEREDKGIIATAVTSITKRGGEAFLHLRGRLSPVGIDTLKLRVFADEYKSHIIHPVEYHSERNVLVLHPEKNFYDSLPSGKCRDIFVISDLRFLVERVYEWYKRSLSPIRLPERSPSVSPPSLVDMAGGIPTAEQYSAVCNVLTTPFSYIWGAPGTGKTRFVLANCVLAYLREDKRVLLTAPTNNALEQMLFGILEVLRSCGIPSARILRLGVPSAVFAARYPECCEHLSAENRRASIVGELSLLERQYQQAERLVTLYSIQSTLTGFYERLQEISLQFQTSTVSEPELASARNDAAQAQKLVDDLENTVQILTVWLSSLPGRAARLFRPAVYSEKSILLKKSTRELEHATQICSDAVNHHNTLVDTNRVASQRYRTQMEELRRQYTEAFQVPFIPELFIPEWVALDSFSARLRLACDAVQTAIEAIPVLDRLNHDEIKSKIRFLETELASLDADHKAKFAEVRILAMTIDRFISPNGSQADFEPEHIFMDEAAYCSLIKGYTLLHLGCPVTLLGDHAQLPPVCEMNESTLTKSFCPEFLWAQSAIHLDSVFLLDNQELYHEYQESLPPRFHKLHRNTLSVTHRFGPGVAHVLSDYIYDGILTSARVDETVIRYIHAPSSPADVSRTSRSECDAICSLGKKLAEKQIDFAVLTPYRRQVALLSKAMPALSAAGRIMTIHAAQGREFHTIILSAVDTTDMFFTDSRKPTGRAVLNTAVSRVKSNLILVLDRDYWETQEKQMIGQLLRIANPISIK